MKKVTRIAPVGSSSVSPYLLVESVETLLEFLVKVFGAIITDDTNRKDGLIQHGEVLIGDTTIMLGRSSNEWPARQSMNYIYVQDTDATYTRALKNGAVPILPPGDRPYGRREAGFADLFGNQWWISHLIGQPELTEEDELGGLELEWCRAIERNDIAKMSAFMADDWITVATEGGIVTKGMFIGLIQSGDLLHSKMDFQVIESRVYNNVGIIVSKGTSEGTFRMQPFTYYEWSTSIFIKAGNRWSAVLTMLNPARV